MGFKAPFFGQKYQFLQREVKKRDFGGQEKDFISNVLNKLNQRERNKYRMLKSAQQKKLKLCRQDFIKLRVGKKHKMGNSFRKSNWTCLVSSPYLQLRSFVLYPEDHHSSRMTIKNYREAKLCSRILVNKSNRHN